MKKQKVPERNEKVRDETLRGENRRLRKEVSRLRKENEKLRGIYNLQAEEDEIAVTEDTLYQPKCPKCQCTIRPFELRNIVYYACVECGARGQYQ